MSKEREALKLALEALENPNDIDEYNRSKDDLAINAIKEVLAHPDSTTSMSPTPPKALQPKQEPVAWAWFDEADGRLAGALDYEQPPHYIVPLYTKGDA